MPIDLKDSLIGTLPAELCIVPFNTIKSRCDTLFDFTPTTPELDAVLDANSRFLATLKLEDMEFENTSNPKKFKIKNKATGQTIEVSNRIANAGELRGEVLRDHLLNEKRKNPQQTAHDVIMRQITDPMLTDIILAARTATTSSDPKLLSTGRYITTTQFNLFMHLLLAAIQKKMETDDVKPERYTLQEVKENKEGVKVKLLEGLDPGLLYDKAEFLLPLAQQIEKLEPKINELRHRGYSKAADKAQALKESLETQLIKLGSGTLDIPQFKDACKCILEDRAYEPLKDHRGFRGFFAGIGNAIVNFFSAGQVLHFFETRTNSAMLMDKLKRNLTNVKVEDSDKGEEELPHP